MKKLFFAIAIVLAASCSKVEPSNLDYSSYKSKATLIVETQLEGTTTGGITVDITVGDIHLRRTSDSDGLIKEVIAFTGSKMAASVTGSHEDGSVCYSGAASLDSSDQPVDNGFAKLVINLTIQNL